MLNELIIQTSGSPLNSFTGVIKSTLQATQLGHPKHLLKQFFVKNLQIVASYINGSM